MAPLLEKISDYVDYYAELTPKADALVVNNEVMNYADLRRRVDVLAKALLASGVRKGDRVATLSTPHPEFFSQFLAAVSIGAIWMGLNPRYQHKEYEYLIGDAQPRIIFTKSFLRDRNYVTEMRSLSDELQCIQQIIDIEGNGRGSGIISLSDFEMLAQSVSDEMLRTARESIDAGDSALLVYTSGTTGKPKGALLPHKGLCLGNKVQNSIWDADPLRILNFLPINHIGCVGDVSCYALVGGGTIVFQEKFDALESLQILQDYRITVWIGVPAALQMTIDRPEIGSYDLSGLQLIIWGGAAAAPDLIESLLTVCPRLTTSYSQTESTCSVTFIEPTDDLTRLTDSIGTPVPEYDFRIADEDGNPVPGDGTGEILVRGDFIMNGYLNRPEATEETIGEDGWLHTGDLARYRPDGAVQLVGRTKEMYISGGYNIYPREIENLLESDPRVIAAAVVPVPDKVFGEIGHAYVQVENIENVSEQQLVALCRTELANYKVPKRILLEEELPVLPIGKIDKMQLRKRSERLAEVSA